MRILHTGDWHLGKNLEGQSRMDEQEKFLEDFIDIVKKNNIDLIFSKKEFKVLIKQALDEMKKK